MSIERRVLARALQRFALLMPPRKLAQYVERMEQQFDQDVHHVLAAVSELYHVDESLGTVSRREMLEALKIPFTGLQTSTLQRPLDEVKFGFSNFQHAMSKVSMPPRPGDNIVTLVTRPIRSALDPSSPLMQAIEKTCPEYIKPILEKNDWEWNEKYEEGVHPTLLSAFVNLHHALEELVAHLNEGTERLDAFSTGDVKPNKVETLYHASVKAREIHAEGFKAEMPTDQIGLGGSQTGANGHNGISFTYDLKSALEIARSFKESAMIATGELKASDILDWGYHDLDLDKFSMWLQAKLGTSFDSPKVEHDGHRWIVKMLNREGKIEEMPIDEALSRPIDVFNVYDAFLFSHPTRLNPVHMNRAALLNYLKDADPKDIGVVAAEVDMSHPGVLSVPGEREFRVPPAAVIKVTRFYS